MQGTKELRTERLFLRKYKPEDAEILYHRFGTDPVMSRYSGWNPYASLEMAQETVERFIRDYEKPAFYGWAIEYNGELIGTIGTYDYDSETNQIETGISIAREYWGQGFATEALRAVLKYLTEEDGIRTVTAWCASENTGSMKAMIKAGMKQTHTKAKALEVNGTFFDLNYYSYSGE